MNLPSESTIRRLWESLTPATILHASDGRPLTVLSTGTPNVDGGPDYTDALIRLNGRLFRGDVEIHGRDRDWFLHHHQTDSHYNRVVLHVVGRQGSPPEDVYTAGKRAIPTLVLSSESTPSLEPASRTPSRRCIATGITITQPRAFTNLRKALKRLGWNRIEARVSILEFRCSELLRSSGNSDTDEVWDQLLYEGFVEGLGYAKNNRAFRELAQILPLSVLRLHNLEDQDSIMAVLFGVSGLLPSSRTLRERESKRYVVRLRKRWKELDNALHCPRMHEADWLFFRLRPVNFPTARIAVLGNLLPRFLKCGVAQRLLGCFREPDLSSHELQDRLRQFFGFVPEGYWCTHLHFRAFAPGPSIALGADRVDDIIFNTLLPLVLLRARISEDRTLGARIRTLAHVMPASSRNSVIRTVERKILGERERLDSALLQYGAIELWKRYCEAGRCRECPIGSPALGRATREQISDI